MKEFVQSHKLFTIYTALVVLIVLVALFAPFLAPQDPMVKSNTSTAPVLRTIFTTGQIRSACA